MMSYSEPSPQNFLLMVENSSALAAFWPDLRDCYLPRLVEQLSGTLPTHLTNIFIAESRPASHDFHNSVTKQCSSLEAGLAECQFNFDTDNRLSVAQIQSGIKFLSCAPTNQMRHLIVVAATTPKDFGIAHLPFDPWNELAKMLTQEEVYLHLALTSNLRSGRLPNLFQQTLKWQQHTEEPLWLPKYSTALIFRVSAPQSYPHSVQTISGERSPCPAQRDFIPPDMYTNKALDDVPTESPTLVSQLQQVHGLTKKKVYGAKPTRIPFILDERIHDRDPYRKAQASNSIPPLAAETGAPPSLTRSRRSRSTANLKVDRPFSARLQRIVTPYTAAGEPHQRQSMSFAAEGDSPDQSPSLSSPPSPIAQMLPSESYPYISGPSDYATGHLMPTVSTDLDLSWAPKPADDTFSGLYFLCDSRPSPATDSSCSFFPDYPESFPVHGNSTIPPLPLFQSFPAPYEVMSTPSAFGAMPAPAFESPAGYFPQRPQLQAHAHVADFDADPTAADFCLDHQPFHNAQEQPGFLFPLISPTRPHIHAPAPHLPIPTTAQMDDLLAEASRAAAALRSTLPLPLPPASIFPPIAAPTFQDRDAASVTLSMQPPNLNAMCLNRSSSGRMVASSGKRDASSSLTGWAG